MTKRSFLRPRTEAIVQDLTDYLKEDPYAKTIVFCVDQEHADTMREILSNLNAEHVQRHPDYVSRITADEGDFGRERLSRFQDIEDNSVTIVTTSKLLTTGVDAPTVKNIVIVRGVGSMVEFKQMIGRGTRVCEEYDKFTFDIIDYTGTSFKHFTDPDFDGDPIDEAEEIIETGDRQSKSGRTNTTAQLSRERKFYVDDGTVTIAEEGVHILNPDGSQQHKTYIDYAGGKIYSLYKSEWELLEKWINQQSRNEIIAVLKQIGIEGEQLAKELKYPDADAFDLFCHVAFGAPLQTRKQRAERVRTDDDFFKQYNVFGRYVLGTLLDKYSLHGPDELKIPDALRVPPISDHGNVTEIATSFGGPDRLRNAVEELQKLLYKS